MKNIVLVRHGQSEDNAGMPSRGLGLTHLTKLGEIQARATADHWREPPDLIVVSPYIRTRQTAAPTAGRFPEVPVETWPIEEFRQLGKARYEGQDIAYRMAWYRHAWETNDPDYIDGEGAESLRTFAGRLDRFADRLREAEFKTAYIFGHGFFLRSFLLRHLWGSTRPMLDDIQHFRASVNKWHFPNCGLVEGRLNGSGTLLLGPVETPHLPEKLQS